MESFKKVKLIIFLFVLVIATGVFGYKWILGVSFLDAFYMTVITISTVGYREVATMSPLAKTFTIFIIMGGLGIVGYGLGSVLNVFFEGRWQEEWRKKKMKAKIEKLSNHYIVCGAGEIGHIVIDQLKLKEVPLVVIEHDEDRAEELREAGVLVIEDNATEDQVLLRAHIREAKSLICTLTDDASNVFTVLTARQLNPSIYIIAKSIDPGAHAKLLRAGADNTVSANEIGGRRMAAMAIRPSIKSFLDVITKIDGVPLDMEEVFICDKSDLVGRSLMEIRIPEKTGLIVLGIRHRDEQHMLFNPSSDTRLRLGDAMMVLGHHDQVDKLRAMACELGS